LSFSPYILMRLRVRCGSLRTGKHASLSHEEAELLAIEVVSGLG
jgi:hypothetical protein